MLESCNLGLCKSYDVDVAWALKRRISCVFLPPQKSKEKAVQLHNGGGFLLKINVLT